MILARKQASIANTPGDCKHPKTQELNMTAGICLMPWRRYCTGKFEYTHAFLAINRQSVSKETNFALGTCINLYYF